MSYVRTSGAWTPLELNEATMDQLAVQNTWYTLAELYNVRVLDLTVECTVANETIEVRWTIDNKTNTRSTAMNFGTFYTASWNSDATGETLVFDNTGQKARSFLFEGRHVKIEIRKTTATGASHIVASMPYNKW
jgi:hypothetical protein